MGQKEKADLELSKFMCGTFKSGFGLLEIMVAITLIALLATVVVPNLSPKNAAQERKTFIAQLNALTRLAVTQAHATRKIHRVYIDFKQQLAHVEVQADKKDAKGDTLYQTISAPYLDNKIAWPKRYAVREYFVEGIDELASGNKRINEVWFYVIPNGRTQHIVINMIDMQDKKRGKPVAVGLVLNPFSAQFEVYDSFQKP